MSYDRTKHIGSSDIAGILGISKYTTPYDIWQRKVEPEKIEITEKQKKLFERGKRAEPLIRAFIEDDLNFKFAETNKQIYDNDNNLFTAELDAVTAEGLHYEIKSASAFMCKQWGETIEEIPLEYLVQVYWAMGIAQKDKCRIAVMIDFDIRYYDVPQNHQIFEACKIKAMEFWSTYVVTKIPPPAINTDDLLKLYPNSSGVKEASPQILHKVIELKSFKSQIKLLCEKKEELEFEIKSFLEDKELLIFDNTKLATFKTQERKAHYVKESKAKVLLIK